MSYPPPPPSPIAGDAGQPFYPSAPSQQQSGAQHPNDINSQLSGLSSMVNANTSIPDGRDLRAQDGDMNQYSQQAVHGHATHTQVHQMHSPGGQLSGAYAPTPEASMAQKVRVKVSHACDECRRKKVKCIPGDDLSEEICKNCRRARVRCTFSRTQLKRGPSKGYIKELADRVHSLESQISPGSANLAQYNSHPASPAQRRTSEDFSVEKRRRISGATFEGRTGIFLASHDPNWTPETRHVATHFSSAFTSPPAPGTAPAPRDLTYSPHHLQTLDLQRASETLIQQSGLSNAMAMQQVYDLDDDVLDSYYQSIHQTYPILSEDRTKLRLRLSTVSASLKEAFYECIHAATRSFPKSNNAPLEQPPTSRHGARYICLSGMNGPRSLAENIVHLQSLMLLAIEGGNVFVTNPGQNPTIQANWLTLAVGLATEMKLSQHRPRIGGESDSDDYMLKKLWWNLVVMDRCSAIIMATQYLISEEALVIDRQYLSTIGDGLWNMSRLAMTLGHYSLVNSTPEGTYRTYGGPSWAWQVSYEVDRCCDTFPPSSSPDASDYNPVYYMLFWHIKILALIESDITPKDLLKVVTSAQKDMVNTAQFVSPLKYQCFMVVVLTLIELSGHEETKEDAEGLLSPLLSTHPISHWDSTFFNDLVDNHRKSQPLAAPGEGEHTSSLDSERLQQLATLAAAANGDNRKAINTDKTYAFIREVIRKGTLSLLIETPI